MAKLLGDFLCVPPGEIYPVTIASGADCPEGLEEHARELGLLPKTKRRTAAADESGAQGDDRAAE